MKRTLPILAGLVVTAVSFAADPIKINIDTGSGTSGAQPAPAAQPAKPAATATTAPAAAPEQEIIAPVDGKYTDIQKMEVYGFMLASRIAALQQTAAIVGSNEELKAFLAGIGRGMIGVPPPFEEKTILPQLEAMVKERLEIVRTKIEEQRVALLEKNSKEAAAFLTTLDTKPNVKKTASGLRYEILKEGTGPKAKPTQAVIANYKASFADGQVFDSSEGKPGKVEFALATAIPGLKEGLQLVGVGGKVKLYMTSDLGFGDSGQVLAPGILTVFEVEVVEVKEPTKQPEEKK